MICWYEQGKWAAVPVHLHVWYLQRGHKTDIMRSTTRTSARMTGARICGQIFIVPRCTTVPGGTRAAVLPIPMGGISHLAQQVISGPWIMGPFVVTLRVYVQWNSCLDKYVRINIIMHLNMIFVYFVYYFIKTI